MTRTRQPRPRPGFTMVELLIVIAIIALLAGLTLVAVTRVQDKGREVRVRGDMTALETAIASFRAKFGNAPVPCFGSGTNGTFQLCTAYTDSSGNFLGSFSASSPEVVVLKRVFPRINLADTGLRDPSTFNNGSNTNPSTIQATAPVLLDPNQCMVFFLSGGKFTDYMGFATDPSRPFLPNFPIGSATSAPARLGGTPLFEFPKNRLVAPIDWTTDEISVWKPTTSGRFSGDPIPSSGGAWTGLNEPWFMDPWNAPYLFFSSNNGNDYPFDSTFSNSNSTVQTTMRQALQIGPWGGVSSAFNDPSNFPGPGYSSTMGPQPYRESSTKFRNPKTVQIISAGKDGIWGIGQQTSGQPYNPGVAGQPKGPLSYQNNMLGGGDDYANFTQNKLGTPE